MVGLKTNLFVMGVSALLLTSCIDKNYDLSDIDTTSQLKVNDLVLPLNIDEVQLKSIIDIGESETVRLIHGDYYVVKEGTFKSDPVKVNTVSLSCTPPEPSSKDFTQGEYPAVMVPGVPVTLPIGSKPTPFTLKTSSVPDYILGIEDVGCNLRVIVTMGFEGFGNHLQGFLLHDAAGPDEGFKIHLPKGLKDVRGAGTYYPETGTYIVPARHYDGASVDIEITIGGIDFAEAGIQFNPDDHSIVFDGDLSVDYSTRVTFTLDDLDTSNLPKKITYFTSFDIKETTIKSFTGDFRYDIGNVNIPQVRLDGIPDVLSQEGTDLRLVNPQLYLSVTNPVAGNPVKAETGINISAIRHGQTDGNFRMDTPLEIRALPQANYVLCPQPSLLTVCPAGFDDAIPHRYSRLGDILSGKGLPQALDIQLENACLPAQHVTDFKLDGELGSVEGKYCFFTPLQVAAGSQIKYIGDTDGWWGDDMDKLEMSHVSVSATVTTDVPIALTFSVYPLDRNGNRIPGVQTNGVTVPAYAKDHDILMSMDGVIRNLDGIHYEAVAAADENGEALSEDMRIVMKNVKIKVTGEYTTDF